MDIDEKAKVLFLLTSAEHGDVDAQTELADIHLHGSPEVRDYEEAFSWYRKAAQQGSAYANAQLGTMYYLGHGIDIDYRKSAEHYRKAALQGNANAMNNLACLYQQGKGVPLDETEAIKWFTKAVELGDAEALTTLGYLTVHGLGVPTDQPKGYHMIRRAAEGGYAPAQRKLGLYYMDGHGMLKNLSEAEKWLTLAAIQGDLESLSTIVDLMLAGKIKNLTRNDLTEWLYQGGIVHLAEKDKETALQCLTALRRLDSTHFYVRRLEKEINKA